MKDYQGKNFIPNYYKTRLTDSLAEPDSLGTDIGLFWQVSTHSALSHCHSDDQDTSRLYPVDLYFEISYSLDQLITPPYHRGKKPNQPTKKKKSQKTPNYSSYFENS